jgi:hypothetical protein
LLLATANEHHAAIEPQQEVGIGVVGVHEEGPLMESSLFYRAGRLVAEAKL